MKKNGSKIWYFPDGYLPQKNSEGRMEAHEALMLLNVTDRPANVKLDFYFSDRDPAKDIPVTVEPERVIALRLDHPDDIGGLSIPPLTQYAIRARSDVDIVAYFGRLDTTQVNMCYYGFGFYADEE